MIIAKFEIRLIFLTILFFSNIFYAQNNIKSFKNIDLYNYQVYQNTYDFWWFKNRWFPSGDTLPYFVDNSKYKGFINYGIKIIAKDKKASNYSEDFGLGYLFVNFTKFNYEISENIIEIEGFVTDSWNDFRNKEKSINIFIGEKKDTISVLYNNIQFVHPERYDLKLNGKIAGFDTKLDSFPSFYLKNYKFYQTNAKKEKNFKIRCKINRNTLLCFGLENCYSEIFNVGEMIFSNVKKSSKKNIKDKSNPIFYSIIEKNKQKKVQNNSISKKDITYYSHTQKAEQFIISKQYAKAKEQYFLLEKNYATLFARDINNAIRCAILSRDLKTAFHWSEKLAKKGVGLTYFNCRIFNGMKKNTQWKIFSKKYDSILKITNDSFNTKLKKEINSLLDEDQADYALENRKDPQVLYETTEKVTNKLISLLEEEGFPSEEKIGALTKNDTILLISPDYNVLIRHAVQQKPEGVDKLIQLLNKSQENFEYDMERSNNHKNFPSACLHIYKGNLYNDKSCSLNKLSVNKITFKFKNPDGFIMDYGDFIVSEYDKENPKEWDDYYEQNFNFIMKLTDDWEFYNK